MSSKMASAVTKTMRAWGTRDRSSCRTPMQKAMSVAMGIPQPCKPGPPQLKAVKMRAGRTMPPSAAMAGSAACARVRSSPTASSRLISIPTTKKKNVISPSLTSWWSEKVTTSCPIPSVTGYENRAW